MRVRPKIMAHNNWRKINCPQSTDEWTFSDTKAGPQRSCCGERRQILSLKVPEPVDMSTVLVIFVQLCIALVFTMLGLE